MKSKPEFETPFEESLADFEMAPLPVEWKSELIGNAVSQAGERKSSRLRSFTRIAIGTLAACWVAIGILHATTPADPDFSGSFARQAELSPDDFPIVAAYFGRLNSSDWNF